MKNLLVILLFFAACTTQVKEDRSSENEQLARAMFDAFNQHDWEKMASYYSDSALFLDPSFGPEYVSQDKVKLAAKYREMQAIFANIHDEIVGIYPSGDKVTVEFVSTGTAADGTTFRLPISSILTIKDGKIIKDATYYDNSH